MAIFKRLRDGKRSQDYWIGYRAADGRYRREKVGPNKALAREILAKRQHDVAERRNFPDRVANATDFSVVAERFESEYVPLMRSPAVRYMLPKIKVAFAGRRIGSITTGDVQRFYNSLAAPKKEGAEPRFSTANRYMALLSSIFSRASEWGQFVGANPCAAIKEGREQPNRTRFLSLAEIGRLLSASGPRLYPVLVAALTTGARRGELLGLDWRDIDLARSTIFLSRTKNGRSRSLPISDKLQSVLINLGPRDSGTVFDLPLASLRRHFAKAMKAAGIATKGPDKATFHTLRHSFASHAVMSGADLYTVQQLLGHSGPAMSARYSHLSQAHLRAAINAVEGTIHAAEPRLLPQAIAPALHPTESAVPA